MEFGHGSQEFSKNYLGRVCGMREREEGQGQKPGTAALARSQREESKLAGDPSEEGKDSRFR